MEGAADEAPVPLAVVFLGSSRADLRAFPDEVKDGIGSSLLDVQYGEVPLSADWYSQYGPGVLVIRESDASGTFRVVVTVRYEEAVYVAHAFRKKSKSKGATPPADDALLRRRLREAKERHDEWEAAQKRD